MCHVDETKRTSAEPVLAILQALHTAGAVVLARGPGDILPILHAAVALYSPALMRWPVIEAGVPVEERNNDDYTPLLFACHEAAWAAAHALLGVRRPRDVQITTVVIALAQPLLPLVQAPQPTLRQAR
jgi:hypothetical protein